MPQRLKLTDSLLDLIKQPSRFSSFSDLAGPIGENDLAKDLSRTVNKFPSLSPNPFVRQSRR